MSKTPGQIAYEAYAATTDWKSAVSGAPLPQWGAQAERIQLAWEAAARAARAILDGEFCAYCGSTPESGTRCFVCGTAPFVGVEKVLTYEQKAEHLQRFKDFVHERLDRMGIKKEPNGAHSKDGCRVGDRLDLVERAVSELRRFAETAWDMPGEGIARSASHTVSDISDPRPE